MTRRTCWAVGIAGLLAILGPVTFATTGIAGSRPVRPQETSVPGRGSSAPGVTVLPATATALLRDFKGGAHPLQFKAAITVNPGGSAVTWDVNGIAGGDQIVGTISDSGLYTPPAVLPNPATVTIRATLQAPNHPSGSSVVTIDRNVRWTTTNAVRTGPCDFASMLANKGTEVDCHYTLSSDRIERDVRFHVGRPYVAGNAAVIHFHGSGGTYTADICTREARAGNWFAMADEKAIVAVCPHGIAGGPQVQGWDIWWTPYLPTVDDGGFAWALLKDVETHLGVSPKKRYITGISAGGDIQSRLVIEDGALIAAMASIDGSMSQFDDQDTLCAAQPRENGPCKGRVLPPMPYPVSSFHIKGTINVNHYHPFCSLNSHSGTLQEDFDYARAQIHAASPVPNTNTFCPGGRGAPEGTETYKKATGGMDGAVVYAYVLQNGLHKWYAVEDISPATCPPADATAAYNCQLRIDFPTVTRQTEPEYVWQFFVEHPQRKGS